MKNTRAAFLVLLSVMSFATCSHPVVKAPQEPERQAKIEKALKELKDDDAEVRCGAVIAIERLRAKEYAKDIAELLKDKDAEVRRRTVETLGKLGAKECAKDIAGLLKEEDIFIRSRVIWALGMLGAKEYVKDIARFLKDEDNLMQGIAVSTLGELGAKEYADEIGKLINDSSQCVVFDKAGKDWKQTTVSAEAERVLKEWGIDTEKLKAENKK